VYPLAGAASKMYIVDTKTDPESGNKTFVTLELFKQTVNSLVNVIDGGVNITISSTRPIFELPYLLDWFKLNIDQTWLISTNGADNSLQIMEVDLQAEDYTTVVGDNQEKTIQPLGLSSSVSRDYNSETNTVTYIDAKRRVF